MGRLCVIVMNLVDSAVGLSLRGIRADVFEAAVRLLLGLYNSCD
jgi:hypothetical protein